MKRICRAFVAFCLALSGLVLVAAPAHACSCAGQPSLEGSVFGAQTVFVGTPGPSELNDEGRVTLFSVDQVLSGDVGEKVTVSTGGPFNSCGEPGWATDPGDKPVVVLAYAGDDAEPNTFSDGSVCSIVPTVNQLGELLSDELETPAGPGAIAALISVRTKWANLMALDASGAVLSWGAGINPGSLQTCAGINTHIVELDWEQARLRDLATMEVVATASTDSANPEQLGAICTVGASPALELVDRSDLDDTVVFSSTDALKLDDVAVEVVTDNNTGQGTLQIRNTDGEAKPLAENLGWMGAQMLAMADGPMVDPVVPPAPQLMAPSDIAPEDPDTTDPADPDPTDPADPTNPDTTEPDAGSDDADSDDDDSGSDDDGDGEAAAGDDDGGGSGPWLLLALLGLGALALAVAALVVARRRPASQA